MKGILHQGFLAALLIIGTTLSSAAQIISGNAFLQSNYLELGIGPCGSFGTTVDAPSGYHPRNSSTLATPSKLGFVADIGKDGWAVGNPNFIGDYFLPGIPEEGWGISVNGVNYNNNLLCSTNDIPGSLTSYTSNSNEVKAVWQGSIAGLDITATTSIPAGSLYFITSVTITNTTSATLNNVYYMRNVDADQGVWTPGGGSTFNTTNSIVFQNPNACNTALVTSVTNLGGYYLGLGAVDARARVTHGGFTNRSAHNVWNAIGLNNSGSVTADAAISIAFNLGNIAPNSSQTFSYSYILNPADLNAGLSATNLQLMVNNVNYANSATANVCSGGPTVLHINGSNSSTTWSWSPAIGLSSSAGETVIANVTVPITYVGTGTGLCNASSFSITLNPIAGSSIIGTTGTITGPSQILYNQSNVSYSIAPVTGATTYVWSLPPGATNINGQLSNTVTFDAPTSYWCGNIDVTPINSCTSANTVTLPVCAVAPIHITNFPSFVCPGDSFQVPYSSSLSFGVANTFNLMLSDSSGDFSSPNLIGSLTGSNSSGYISCQIPYYLPEGSQYQVRIQSTSPSNIGVTYPIGISVGSLPIISTPGTLYAFTDSAACGAYVNFSATVSGSGSSISYSNLPGSWFTTGTTSVTVTATNSCGVSTASFDVVVIDNEIPKFVCPHDTIVSNDSSVCGAYLSLPTPTATDNCGIQSVINLYTYSNNASALYSVGTTTISWLVTDINGNSNFCQQHITVLDTEAPTFDCPQSTVLSADAGLCSGMVNLFAPLAFDNCGVDSIYNTINHTGILNTSLPVGTHIINWIAKDVAGNSTTCSQQITILDNETPVILCGGNVSAFSGTNCQAALQILPPTVSDNCGIASLVNSFNYSNNASGNYPIGNTQVLWTVTDIHGNQSTCSQNISVTDNIAPSISCANNVTAYISPGSCLAAISIAPPIVSDNCGIASIVNDYNNTANASGNYPTGSTTVNWLVTDVNGNTNSCTQYVTVADNQLPTINCGASVSQVVSSNTATYLNVLPSVANDNCGIASVANSLNGTGNASGYFNLGVTNIVWTATDVNGNSKTCTQTVNVSLVVPTQSVLANCKPYTLILNNGVGTLTVANINNGSSASAGIASMSLSKTNFTCADIGVKSVTLTITDVLGHVATCTSQVTVVANSTGASITVTPTNNTYTGGVPTTIYLGYGPQSANLCANWSGASGVTYNWSPANYLSCTNCKSPVFTPTSAGSYTFTVTMTKSGGCSVTKSVSFCVFEVRVNPSNSNSNIYLCHKTSSCTGNTSNLLSVSKSAVSAHLNHPGDHLGNCSMVCSTCARLSEAAVEEIELDETATEPAFEEDLKVYPNPSLNDFRFKTSELENSVKSIEVFSASGSLVWKQENLAPNYEYNFGADLVPGVYLLQLETKSGSKIFKLVKIAP